MERKGTGKLREENSQKIKQYFVLNKTATKKEIAQKLNISVMTVGTILSEMLHDNTIIEKEYDKPRSGRPTCIYEINPDCFHLLTCRCKKYDDIHYLIFEVVDALDCIVYQNTLKQKSFDINIFYNELQDIILHDACIQKVGIGIPGIIQNGMIEDSDIGELKGINLKEQLSTFVKQEMMIYNDMKCCAYGYYKQMEDKCDLCFATFPKNSLPGCGYIINGKLYTGKNGIAGEMMFLPLFHYLQDPQFDYDTNTVIHCLASIIAMMNPAKMIITGDFLLDVDKEELITVLKTIIPESFVPDIDYIENYDDYYLIGIKQLMIEEIL